MVSEGEFELDMLALPSTSRLGKSIAMSMTRTLNTYESQWHPWHEDRKAHHIPDELKIKGETPVPLI